MAAKAFVLIEAAVEKTKKRSIETVFNDCSVVIDFEVLDANQEETESVVQAWGSPEAKVITTHHRIRRRVSVRAGKYGEMTILFIAV